jgi:CTP:molybdopterin cytidylyltransferase MocA
MVAAIITARGGSRRLPRKNVKSFCEIPLVGWAIIQAKCSKNVNDVFVTTDDDEIEMVAKQYGADVIRRPDWPDANEAAANRPFIHAIEILNKLYPGKYDTILTILPTTPLNKPNDMDDAIEAYRKFGADVVTPFRLMRETVIKKRLNDFRFRNHLFSKKYEYLGEAGGWNVCSPEWYLQTQKNLPSDLDKDLDKMASSQEMNYGEGYYIPMEQWQYADTDTLEEFEMAELIMEHFILKGKWCDAYYSYGGKYKTESQLIKRGKTILTREEANNG